MKTRVLRGIATTCVLAVLGGIASPMAQADDTKPMKGRAYQTSRVYLSEVPDDPYLQEIVEERGAPDYVLEATQIEHNNVGGRCVDSVVEIGYLGVDEVTGRQINRFYGSGVTVTANGDTFEWVHRGLAQLEDDPLTFEYTLFITGGTGRFEGASGIVWGQGAGPFPYPSTCEGVMSTVGSQMRNK